MVGVSLGVAAVTTLHERGNEGFTWAGGVRPTESLAGAGRWRQCAANASGARPMPMAAMRPGGEGVDAVGGKAKQARVRRYRERKATSAKGRAAIEVGGQRC
jgi:hypothetical protein